MKFAIGDIVFSRTRKMEGRIVAVFYSGRDYISFLGNGYKPWDIVCEWKDSPVYCVRYDELVVSEIEWELHEA